MRKRQNRAKNGICCHEFRCIHLPQRLLWTPDTHEPVNMIGAKAHQKCHFISLQELSCSQCLINISAAQENQRECPDTASPCISLHWELQRHQERPLMHTGKPRVEVVHNRVHNFDVKNLTRREATQFHLVQNASYRSHQPQSLSQTTTTMRERAYRSSTRITLHGTPMPLRRDTWCLPSAQMRLPRFQKASKTPPGFHRQIERTAQNLVAGLIAWGLVVQTAEKRSD